MNVHACTYIQALQKVMIKAIIQASTADLNAINSLIERMEFTAETTETFSRSSEARSSEATTSLVPYEPQIEPIGDPFAVFRRLGALSIAPSTPTPPPSTPTPPIIRAVSTPTPPIIRVVIRAH